MKIMIKLQIYYIEKRIKMDSYEYSETIKELETKLDNIEKIVNPEKLEKKLKEIDEIENRVDFWNNPKEVAKIQKEKNIILRKLNKYKEAKQALNDNKDMYELASLEEDRETLEEVFKEINELKKRIKE